MSQDTFLVLACLIVLLSRINAQSQSSNERYLVETVSAQCIKLNSTYVGACHEEPDYPIELRCVHLRCAIPQDKTVAAFPELVGPAAMGTSCGLNKVCINLKCTDIPDGIVYEETGNETLSHCHPEGNGVDEQIKQTARAKQVLKVMETGKTNQTSETIMTGTSESTHAPEILQRKSVSRVTKTTRATWTIGN